MRTLAKKLREAPPKKLARYEGATQQLCEAGLWGATGNSRQWMIGLCLTSGGAGGKVGRSPSLPVSDFVSARGENLRRYAPQIF